MKKSIVLSPSGARRPARFALPDWAIGVITVLALLALWEIGVQIEVLNARNFPPPSKLARSMWALVTVGFPRGITVWLHIKATILRILKGYALATVLAIPLGLLVGRSYILERISLPLITFARSVATISLLPLAVAWFGVEENTRVFLITYGTFWVIITNVIEGVKQVDPDLIRAAQTLGATQRQIFYRVVLPSSLPRIFAGMKVALGLAFLVIVAVEMIGTIEGLGALIMEARTYYRSDIAMVGMIFMALFGFALAKALDWVEKLLLPWATGLEEVER
jgi:ABC-type nitrate/sulfonate/bicarbonate transport system permease component